MELVALKCLQMHCTVDVFLAASFSSISCGICIAHNLVLCRSVNLRLGGVLWVYEKLNWSVGSMNDNKNLHACVSYVNHTFFLAMMSNVPI